MISMQAIAQRLTDGLNAIIANTYDFVIMADGGAFVPSVRANRSNTVTEKINGVAEIISATITPINGIEIATQTVGVSVLVRIDKSKGFDNSVNPIRNAIAQYMSQADIFSYTADGVTYSASMYGSQPEVGSREQRPSVGDSVDFNFICNYTFVQNGINSQQQSIKFDNAAVPFTQMVISRVPVGDAGAFSDTNGNAKNWHNASAMQLDISVPALSNNAMTTAFFGYLLNGGETAYDVEITLSGMTAVTKRMIFGQCNATAQTVENVGLTISLVEVLENG